MNAEQPLKADSVKDHLTGASPVSAAEGGKAGQAPARLTPEQIAEGWLATFSTNNPYCPCDLRSFTKAVRWAESKLRATGA